MDPIYLLQAEVCRTLSHPARIAILHLLADGPVSVNTLATELDISQPNASQHLSVMRAAGLVEAARDGREVIYRLADPEVIGACESMAHVMRRRLTRLADLSARLEVGIAASPPRREAGISTAAGRTRS
jgi:DNA-binding transcriptional ArsR family regulator